MKNEITQEILNERAKESKTKTDHLALTLPKGTNKLIIELTGERPTTFCNRLVIEYVKRLKAETEEKDLKKKNVKC